MKALLLGCFVLFPIGLFAAEGSSTPNEFKELPPELRQRATAVFTATYSTYPGPHVQRGTLLVRMLLARLAVQTRHFGDVADRVEVNPAELPKSEFVDPEPKSGRTYLVLLDREQKILALVCLSPKAERVDIVAFGRFRREAKEARLDAPGTSSGYVNVVDAEVTPELVDRTDRIEASVGSTFGLLFRAEGTAGTADVTAPIRIRVLHPLTTNPETGHSSITEEWDAPANLGIIRFTGWTFEAPWETVPGSWTIEILQDGVVMARKEFTVTPRPST